MVLSSARVAGGILHTVGTLCLFVDMLSSSDGMRVSLHKSVYRNQCGERKFQLVQSLARRITETPRARRPSEKPQISRHGHVARNTEVLPLQECVEYADDVRLRVYDTEWPLLYSRAPDTLSVTKLARGVSCWQIFGKLS